MTALSVIQLTINTKKRTRYLALFFVFIVLSACKPHATNTPKHPLVVGVYAVWLKGSNDQNRHRIDDFMSCLLESSNLNQYWRGEARVTPRGSWSLKPPTKRQDWSTLEVWLEQHIKAGHLPKSKTDETPLYLVFGGEPTLWVGACGRNAMRIVDGKRSGLGVVRNNPHCWPTKDRLRTETQIATHEIVETVDRLLGHGTCAGGGACRGRSVCQNPCDTFVGLACPGAPEKSYTGCSGGIVKGWVVQKFSYAGRKRGQCERCTTCDFTPRLCTDKDANCTISNKKTSP